MLEGSGGRDVYVIIATTKFRAEIQTRTHHGTAAGKIHDQRSRSDRPGADGGYEEAKAEVAEAWIQ